QNLWMAALLTYHAQVDKVRSCPLATEPTKRTDYSPQYTYGAGDQMWKWAPYTNTYKGSYAFNGWLYTRMYSVTGLMGATNDWKFGAETTIKHPVDTPLLGDAIWVDGWPREAEGPPKDLYLGNAGTGVGRFCIARHGGAGPLAAPRAITSSEGLPAATTIA